MRMLFAALAFTASPASAEYIAGSEIGFGNWHGAAYTFDETGRFSHCAVSAPYLSGDTLYLSVNQNATVTVGIESPGLNMTPGQEIPVTLYIDRRAPFYGRAYAVNPTFATLILADFEAALTALQKGRLLVVESAVGRGTYDLTGTYRALNATLDCAVQHMNYASSPAAPAQAPTTEVSSAPVDKTVLFQVATGMIADLGMTDFQYLSEAETKALFPGDAVAWNSPSMGMLGGVVAISSNGLTDLKETDGADISFLAKDCSGDVATTSRNVSLADYQSRELRSMCVEGSQSTETFLNKTLVGGTVLYTLLVFNQAAAVNEPQQRQALSEKAAIRAASFIKE